MRVCTMHVSMIIDPHACVFDACMMPMPMRWLKFCDGRTNKAILGVGCFYDACLCDACKKWGRTDEQLSVGAAAGVS